MDRSRAWCFTINNWTDTDYAQCRALQSVSKFGVVGKETGELGTPHLQGYVYFQDAKSMTSVSKLLARAHLIRARASPDQNMAYCSKEGNYDVWGELPVQGKRTDLTGVKEALDNGESMLSIADGYWQPWVKYYKAFAAYEQLKMSIRNSPPNVEYIWGATGVGKSRYAYESSPSVYFKANNKWWDGYVQQHTIVIDDIDPQHWSLRELLTLLDRYPCQREIKGGSIQINSPRIIITADRPLEQLYSMLTPNELAQLQRRITVNLEKLPDKLAT